MVARRRPKIPRNHAGGVPDGIPVRAAIPQVNVPSEPVDRLAANAAKARPARVALLAIRCWRNPETCCSLPTLPRAPPPPPPASGGGKGGGRGRVGRGLAIVRFAPSRAGRLFIGEPPHPSGRGAAAPRKRAGKPV